MSAQTRWTSRRLLDPVEAALSHLAVSPGVEWAGDSSPAVLLLHGRGADERDLMGLIGTFDPRFLVVSARAPLSSGWGYQWYELVEVGTPGPVGIAQSLDVLCRFIPEIVSGYGIDPARLVLLGFSQGAVMSAAVALSRPELAAGAVLLSGYLSPLADLEPDAARLGDFPVFVGHGVRDPIIPISFGRQARDELTGLGVDLTYREYPIEHRISDEELSDVATWIGTRLRVDSAS